MPDIVTRSHVHSPIVAGARGRVPPVATTSQPGRAVRSRPRPPLP